MDHQSFATDYHTYREIMSELMQPIEGRDLENEVLVRLYQSKLVYLENLRTKCFIDINANARSSYSREDYALILEAIRQSKEHLRQAVLAAIVCNINRRHAV